MAASTTGKESTIPPPIIGKAGRYTVFLTPPSTPKPRQNPTSDSPKIPPQTASPRIPPPVQPPPQQFDKKPSPNSSTLFGFFWNAVARVQDVHSSMDEYLADWFGLNQSRYQWALNDYYESKGIEKEGAKPKEMANKV
ncbi:proline-rich protein 12 [Cinnamomum micranthum f. kanehirae]|uniref:Proline-rich protein 12 n=1 Tax=Cinnamomum micranthum f. kanehirae TaxID=337451 RepID=A0A3S3MF86_9MAGN|nr:proline-rich protein 12 [Cinnamomum micranthum f. kanehirae]